MARVAAADEAVVAYVGEVILADARARTLRRPPDLAARISDWISADYTPAEIKQISEKLFEDLQRSGIIPGYVPPPPPPPDEDGDEDGGEGEGDEDDEDEGELLKDGECELCEREMPLTKHHVIPKELHPRYLKKGFTKRVLNEGIFICRPCHNAVHSFFDHKTLASSGINAEYGGTRRGRRR
eukprot:TRINITY_DN22883_c0_g1_i1.p2 TRINITY_DN22883_c0_g1~~TRINITY_DN22883_c0_g1_i1.p2  ORF type:complete len:183 (+),score=67.03 TRINITY_DN22883_c0_g1_i1:96-644(+)